MFNVKRKVGRYIKILLLKRDRNPVQTGLREKGNLCDQIKEKSRDSSGFRHGLIQRLKC